MSERIDFTHNYSDLSNENGFQFEFRCDRCSSGYRTEFRRWATGTVGNVLRTAGGLFGGVLGTAARVGDEVRDAAYTQARDKAFDAATEEMGDTFRQCPRCQAWVCREACWNDKRGLCKGCAPDLGVEMSAAQASRSVEEVWAHAKMAEEDKKLAEGNWRETIRASCPECEAPLATNAKFCPNCGAKLKAAAHCSECGAKLGPNAKFCAECGAKVE
jgi:hypothetical protein